MARFRTQHCTNACWENAGAPAQPASGKARGANWEQDATGAHQLGKQGSSTVPPCPLAICTTQNSEFLCMQTECYCAPFSRSSVAWLGFYMEKPLSEFSPTRLGSPINSLPSTLWLPQSQFTLHKQCTLPHTSSASLYQGIRTWTTTHYNVQAPPIPHWRSSLPGACFLPS